MKRKVLSWKIFFLCMFVLYGGIVVNADEQTWDLTVNSYTNSSESSVVWSGDFVTMVLDKARSTTPANNYLGGIDGHEHTRVYQYQEMSFIPADNIKISSIELTSTSSTYAKKSMKWTNANATIEKSVITVKPVDKESEVSVTFNEATRFTKVVVTYSFTSSTRVLSSISLSGTYPTTFYVNDVFSHDGIIVTASYENSPSIDVTDDAVFSVPDMTTTGPKTVTVSYTEGEVTKTADYTIMVNEVAVMGITVNPKDATILVGNTKTLTAIFEPQNATDKSVTWNSDNVDVATVDEYGVVTGVAVGTATITAMASGFSSECEVTVVNELPDSENYTLVTNVSDLAAGDNVIIVNKDANKAMGGQGTNNRWAMNIDFDESERVIVNEDIQVFTLEGNIDGWYFKTLNTIWNADPIVVGYIYAGSNSSNQLKTKDNKDDYAKALISISDDGGASVVFQGGNERNDLRYNPNNGGNPLFSCYASTSTLAKVQIYRQVKWKDVRLTISDVGYSTLYYSDRALLVPDGVIATTYSVANGKLAESKTYEAGMTIPEGEAVVLKGSPGKYRFAVTSTTEENDANNKLKGSDSAEKTSGGTLYYALTLNKQNDPKSVGFYWMNETGTAFTNGAHKAYLALDGSLGGGAQAKSSYLFSEVTTDINSAEAVAHDAIQKGYNLNGQRVSQGYRGFVIVNGRKYIAK